MNPVPRKSKQAPLSDEPLRALFDAALAGRCGVGPGDGVLVAVSGGADSVALLELLLDFRARRGYPELHAAHLDHAVRGARGRRAAERVRRLCAARGVPCTIGTLPPWSRPPSEEALRRARHAFLERVAESAGAGRIALAHHLRDQAETVLWHLSRGSGRRGLGAMRPVSRRRIRPLLEIEPEDLRRFLRRRRVRWSEDETNRSTAFTRNRVRALIPLLERRVHPAARRNLARAAAILACEDDLLDELARERLRRLSRAVRGSAASGGSQPGRGRSGAPGARRGAPGSARGKRAPAAQGVWERGLTLEVAPLLTEHPALLRRILRLAAAQVAAGRVSLSQARTRRLEMLARSQRGRIDLGGGIRAERRGRRLILRSGGAGRLTQVSAEANFGSIVRSLAPGGRKG